MVQMEGQSVSVDKAGGSMGAPLHCLRNATGGKNGSLPQIIPGLYTIFLLEILV